MRLNSIILAVTALLFAGGAVLLARSMVATRAAAPAAEAIQAKRAVLVAHEMLPMGRLVKPTDLIWQIWPEGDLSAGYIVRGTHEPADFAGWVVRSPIGAGEPITGDKLVAPGDRGFLAAVLRPDMRAVSIAVDATSGISGLVFPGDQVDILLTHVLPADQNKQHKATETILRDVRVIAIDQKTSSKPDEPTVVRDVTVEVTPKQSETIAVTNAMGKLSLSLRSIARSSDDPAQAGSGLAGDRRKQSYTLDSEASRLIGAVAPHVIVLHGAQTEDVVFGGDKR
jgi:pilus assembly protein CpaB